MPNKGESWSFLARGKRSCTERIDVEKASEQDRERQTCMAAADAQLADARRYPQRVARQQALKRLPSANKKLADLGNASGLLIADLDAILLAHGKTSKGMKKAEKAAQVEELVASGLLCVPAPTCTVVQVAPALGWKPTEHVTGFQTLPPGSLGALWPSNLRR
mmetsp:Transcript_8143/g.30594  ORF Transcript_8143/g.30594 Transcript_8143/m.30594 type:complete len:163 (-) Transcript_8143:222-710(-)